MKMLLKAAGCFLLLMAAACILLLPDIAADAVQRGLHICSTSILPALFPFFVLSEFWIRKGYADSLSRFLSPVMERFFHLPGSASSALIMGSIGGYPVGARTVAHLYQNGSLSKHHAERALLFCNNAGPAFVFSVLGSGIFHSQLAGLVLYLIHLISAVTIGILFRPSSRPQSRIIAQRMLETESTSRVLTASITQAGKTAIQVCTYVVFFCFVTEYLLILLPAGSTLYSPFSLLIGTLELSGGAQLLSTLPMNLSAKFTAASVLLSWGGICVHMQSRSILQSVNLSAKTMVIGKLLQAVLSGALAFLVFPCLPLTSPCIAVLQPEWLPAVQTILLISIYLIIVSGFLKITSGNTLRHRI